MGIQKPQYFTSHFSELTQRYGIVVGEMAGAFPAHAASPSDPAASEKFAQDQGNLQQLQADTFQLRSQLEADMDTLATSTRRLNTRIANIEEENGVLEGELAGLDSQSQSARGRLEDYVFLYREAVLSNLTLLGMVGGACLIALRLRPTQ